MSTETNFDFYCDNSKEWTYTLVSDSSDIVIDDSKITTLEYKPSYYYDTVSSVLDNWSPQKHFNCRRCGAPNQIDVCEYCGSAAEE